MPTYKLTAVQKISITADINATNREQAIERFADFLHGWVNRANEEGTTAGKQSRAPAFSLLDIDENERSTMAKACRSHRGLCAGAHPDG
jgi:hypothetical protein